MSKRQKSCKNCGHEQSNTSDNQTGSAQDIVIQNQKSKEKKLSSLRESNSSPQRQEFNTLPQESAVLGKKPQGLVTVGDLDPQFDDYMEK